MHEVVHGVWFNNNVTPLGRFMTNGRHIPTALLLVSYLFLITAILSAVDIAAGAMSGHVHPNFGILGLFVFDGLRRYSRIWRTVALVFTWLGLIVFGGIVAFILCAMIFNAEQVIQAPPFDFGDIKEAEASLIWPLAIYAPLFVLQIWQYRILRRPDIRSLFYREQRAAT